MVFQSKIQNSFTVTVVAEQIALPVDLKTLKIGPHRV